MVIYKIINKINGKIYIGQSRYMNDNYLGSGNLIKEAVHKYGRNNFEKEYIDFANSQDELDEKEKFWISKLNSQDPEIGYNIADGGWNHLTITEDIKKKISNTWKKKYNDGYINNRLGTSLSDDHKKAISNALSGRKLSKETKDKLSKVNKGKKHSIETKMKISESHMGKKLSKKHKESISKSLIGRPVSDDTKKKLRESNINKTQKHSKKVKAVNKKTGMILEFNNISQAARELGTHRSYITKNKVKGFIIKLMI